MSKDLDINKIMKAAGLKVVKTSDETMLDQLGASRGHNSCSTVIVKE